MTAPAGLFGPTRLGEPGTAVWVYQPGTTNLATLYSDTTETTQAANPTVLDSFGNLAFYADEGSYDVLVGDSRLTVECRPDPSTRPTLTYSRAAAGETAAGAAIRAALASAGIIIDNTTA